MKKIYECGNKITLGIDNPIYLTKNQDGTITLRNNYDNLCLTEETAYDMIHALSELINFDLY